jgi:hypothetical protein
MIVGDDLGKEGNSVFFDRTTGCSKECLEKGHDRRWFSSPNLDELSEIGFLGMRTLLVTGLSMYCYCDKIKQFK